MQRRKEITLHGYAQVAGIGLVLLGLAGLVNLIADFKLFGDVLHLSTGVLLGYVALRKDARAVRGVLMGLGILYLLAGMLVPAWNLLDGLPIGLYENGEDLFHVVFGLISAFAALGLDSKNRSPAS